MWPAWTWINRASHQWLCGSYAAKLAIRDSLKMRRLVTSPWYRDRWGDRFTITSDQNQKIRFENDRAGYRIAFGMESGVMGDGGDTIICLGYNECVTTDRGLIPIGEIVTRRMAVLVLGFDHETRESKWSPILAHEQGPGRSMVRVTLSDGRTLDATTDHPVFIVGRGYLAAASLKSGDQVALDVVSLRCLRRGVQEAASSRSPVLLVRSVERIATPERVYNVRTETRNYYANGILVHNCDDPHDRQGAHSDAERETTLTTFDEAVVTRLNDPETSSIVVIMQRLHENDLSGHVLGKGGYEHLLIPMHYDPKRSRVTTIGWEDPRKNVGELMHPERFPEEIVREIEKAIGSYAAAGQLEQAPAPAEGGIFKRSWWRFYDELPADFDREIQSWDLSFKGNADSDFVAGQAWGKKGADCYLKPDEVYAQLDFNDTCAAIIGFSQKHPRGAKLIEDKANGPAVIASLKKKVPGIVAVNPDGDKVARGHAVSPYIEAGNVYLPNPYDHSGNLRPDRAWVLRFIENAAKFPNGSIPAGSHGDDIDAMTQALHRLMHMTKTARIF